LSILLLKLSYMNKKYLIIEIILFILLLISGTLIFILIKLNKNKVDNDTSNVVTNESDTSESNKLSTTEEPNDVVHLVFIHHSTGENWLSDDNGGLGIALSENNYFVSDTNYGWGSDSIGDTTDIGNWWLWFRSTNSNIYLDELYNENNQYSTYTRLEDMPSGENEIIMFKSCFPNSALKGDIDDSIPDIESNPLKGEASGSDYHTVSNAKGIYIDVLKYFETRQDKLFIVITAPPLSDSTYADNARSLNNWLARDWLSDYDYKNVAVFDFFDILGGKDNTLDFPTSSGDDHPSKEGNLKATEEFIPFLNNAYNIWENIQND